MIMAYIENGITQTRVDKGWTPLRKERGLTAHQSCLRLPEKWYAYLSRSLTLSLNFLS